MKELKKKSPGVSKSGVCLTSQFCTALNGTEQKKKQKTQLCSVIPRPQAVMLPVGRCPHLSLWFSSDVLHSNVRADV